jgi:hypothetical protein
MTEELLEIAKNFENWWNFPYCGVSVDGKQNCEASQQWIFIL